MAWSTFATGTNPGGHGVFDFLRRDPRTYQPTSGLNRYEQKNARAAPRAVNLRRGSPLRERLSIVSDHGARRLDGGSCVDEWLVRGGLLVLHQDPDEVTPIGRLDVDWGKTRAWSEGGYYARVFLNVKGREPRGAIDPADYKRARDELKARLEATAAPDGRPLGTLVLEPEAIYRSVRNVAPDLIVHFGGLAWRSIGGVGHRCLHLRENDTGPDDCNHSQHGAMILAAPGGPLHGPIEGAHLLDIAPTLLDLGGYDGPRSMQGRSLATEKVRPRSEKAGDTVPVEDIVRDRLNGLGYLG